MEAHDILKDEVFQAPTGVTQNESSYNALFKCCLKSTYSSLKSA